MHSPTHPHPPPQVASAARPRRAVAPLPWVLVLLVLLFAVALWRSEVAGADAAARAQESMPPAQWQRQLRFEDRPNGDVAVIDTASGQEIAHYQGEQGFLRGTLRSFARERALRGIGPQAPLELIGHVNGRLSLVDPATGQRIALESFGPSNLAVFAALRSPAPPVPPSGVNHEQHHP